MSAAPETLLPAAAAPASLLPVPAALASPSLDTLQDSSYSSVDISVPKHTVHWFRKGLRLHDNPALLEGVKNAATLRCIFIIDPWFAASNVGTNKWRFLLQCLENLDNNLRELNTRLFVVRGQPTDALPKLFKEWDTTMFTFEQDPEPFGKVRDHNISAMCKEMGITVVSKVSHTLYDLDKIIELNGGKAPLTYHQFQALVASMPPPQPPQPTVTPGTVKEVKMIIPENHNERFGVPTLEELGFEVDNLSPPVWIGGETEGLARLDRHLERKAWVASFGRPKMTPQSLLASQTGLSPYLRGCMGKLFSPDGQSPTPRPCCRGGCCRRNSQFNSPSGEGNPSCMGACTGSCNPVQMYSDTYNFLNKNLMQPTVQEVMSDFQDMNATNTVGAIGGNAGDPGPMGAGQMAMAKGSMGMPTGQMGMSNTGKMGRGNMGMPNIDGGQMGVGDMVMNDRGQIIEAQGQGIRTMGEGMGNMNQGMGNVHQGMGVMNQGTGGMGHGTAGMGEQIMNMMNMSGRNNMNPKGLMPNQGSTIPNQGGIMPNQRDMMPNHGGMTSYDGALGMNQGNMGMANKGGIAIPFEGGMPVAYQPGMAMPNQRGVGMPNQGGMGMPNHGGMAMPNQRGMSMTSQGGMGMPNQGGMSMTNQEGMGMPNHGGMSMTKQGGMGMPNQGAMEMQNQTGMSTPNQRGMVMSNRRGMPNQGVMGTPNQGGATMSNMAQSNVSVPPGQGSLAAGEGPCIANPRKVCQHHVCRHGVPKGITFNQLNPGAISGLNDGDPGFDPMAIAMQMNPANQRLSAINMMNNMMSSNRGFNNYINNFMGNKPQQQVQEQLQQPPEGGTEPDQIQPSQTGVIASSQISDPNATQDSQSIQNVSQAQVPQSDQSAVSQNTNAPPAEQTYGTGKLASITKTQAPVITEPIYAINSRHPSRRLGSSPPSEYEMNALGQAVRSTPSGRQQSAAQPSRQLQSLPMPSDELHMRTSDPMRQSYVKSTVSKTSIPRQSFTRIPSRGQINVNRQSYSATGTNQKQANQGATRSDGRLYHPKYMNEPARSLEQVSKVAGDATSGLPISGYPPTVDAEQIKGEQDELNKNGLPPHQTPPPPTAMEPIKRKCNGLQDRDFLAFRNLSYSFGGRPYSPVGRR